MAIEAQMKHLFGPFWLADRKTFLFPGIYFKTRRIIPFLPPYQVPQLIEFQEQTVVIAKDQPQYRPLPAYRYHRDVEGKIIFCWKLNWRDRLKVLRTGILWHQVMTFNAMLQPQLLLTDKPEMPKHNK